MSTGAFEHRFPYACCPETTLKVSTCVFFFFFFFFCCAGSWRRWPPTLQEDLWLSMFYVVFATVRARASGNEQRVRETGQCRNSFHTTVLGRSGPLNMLNRRQKWLPRAHSNRALYFWCTLQPPQVRVWRLFFMFLIQFFWKSMREREKKHQKINTVFQQRKHESVMVVSLM